MTKRKEPLGFNYTKTNSIIYAEYRIENGIGKWGELKSSQSDEISINVMSGALHYAIQVFEGLKAYRGVDGKVRIFRPQENGKRMYRSAEFLGMPPVPVEMFVQGCINAVNENIDFLPEYGDGSSMYIRPFLFSTNSQLSLELGKEFIFMVAVSPIGSYTGGSLGSTATPTKALLVKDIDRAAPQGTGSYKIGANYASSLLEGVRAAKEGYSAVLYLDSKEKKYIDEFGSANFFGVKNGTYITPDSTSVLPSITNKSLRTLAEDLGINVEMRPIPVEELSTFDEAGACGTALVITPVHEIYDRMDDILYTIGSKTQMGPISQILYKELTGIQFGEKEDKHNWCVVL